ncbi:MAG: hypothetical protein JO249_23495 [Acidobacteria bacterium]|nr:hypothetical protein [Acidobacteriota bacterium]
MHRIRPALLVCLLASSLLSSKASEPPQATVSFTLDFPQSTPDHYSIVIDTSGNASYTSGLPKPESQADSETTSVSDQPYHYGFTLSPATRDRIFDLAARANYFSGKLDDTRHNMANTGVKTLRYKDSRRSTEAKYNYTTNSAVQQLTALFQRLSTTLEYGRRLSQAYQYQKLALDEELKGMEQQADQNELVDVEAVAPILKKIVGDSSVMNVTRARAERLLEKAKNSRAAE